MELLTDGWELIGSVNSTGVVCLPNYLRGTDTTLRVVEGSEIREGVKSGELYYIFRTKPKAAGTKTNTLADYHMLG